MKICRNCGAQLRDEDLFCSRCGTRSDTAGGGGTGSAGAASGTGAGQNGSGGASAGNGTGHAGSAQNGSGAAYGGNGANAQGDGLSFDFYERKTETPAQSFDFYRESGEASRVRDEADAALRARKSAESAAGTTAGTAAEGQPAAGGAAAGQTTAGAAAGRTPTASQGPTGTGSTAGRTYGSTGTGAAAGRTPAGAAQGNTGAGNAAAGSGQAPRGGGNSSGRSGGKSQTFRTRADEKGMYRESFQDERENGSHALLVTATILIFMALLLAVFTVCYFFLQRNRAVREEGNAADAIEIIEGEAVDEADDDSDSLFSAILQQSHSADAPIVILENSRGETEYLTGDYELPAADGDTASADGSGSTANADGAANADGSGSTANADGTANADDTAAGADGAAETQTEASDAAATAAQAAEPATGTLLDTDQIAEILSLESSAAKSGVYIYDISRGEAYAVLDSADAMYPSALITVPILYTAASKMDAGELKINDMVTYVNSVGGRGEGDPTQREGNDYPIAYYLQTMLKYSDNNCMNVMLNFFGFDEINATCHAAGYASVNLQRAIASDSGDGKENYVSAQDLAGMVRDLYGDTFTSIGKEFMASHFKVDSGDALSTVLGTASALTDADMFLNQNGRGDTRYAEVAVVSRGGKEYIISVMLSGEAGFTYEDALTDISDYVCRALTA